MEENYLATYLFLCFSIYVRLSIVVRLIFHLQKSYCLYYVLLLFKPLWFDFLNVYLFDYDTKVWTQAFPLTDAEALLLVALWDPCWISGLQGYKIIHLCCSVCWIDGNLLWKQSKLIQYCYSIYFVQLCATMCKALVETVKYYTQANCCHWYSHCHQALSCFSTAIF
jgi:hypothetical protein